LYLIQELFKGDIVVPQGKRLGILIFDDVEVLDFTGPYEVFSTTRLDEATRRESVSPFEVLLVAEKAEAIRASGDFSEKYWFGFRFEVGQKVGGKVRIIPPKGMEEHGDHAGSVLECEPGRKLVYTWNQKDEPEVAAKRRSLLETGEPMAYSISCGTKHEDA